MDGYRVDKPIGRGGMATVFEGCKIFPGGVERPVAIKQLMPQYARDPGVLARFHREAILGFDLSQGHPNLVSIYDYQEDEDGRPFIVMERLDGVTLDRLLRVPLSPEVVRRLLRDIAGALAFLHGCRVLHRDLSLRNILVSRTGQVKLLDFGFARHLDSESEGSIRGTMPYASPEALQGMHSCSSDLYSMAAIGYHLLAGKPPFGDGDAVEIHRRMAICQVAPLPAKVPEDLRGVVEGLLAVAEERRLRSAAEVRDQLEGPVATASELAALVDGVMGRSHDPPPERYIRDTGPMSERRPRYTFPAIDVLMLAGLLLLCVINGVYSARSTGAAEEAPPEARRLLDVKGDETSRTSATPPVDDTRARLEETAPARPAWPRVDGGRQRLRRVRTQPTRDIGKPPRAGDAPWLKIEPARPRR